MFTPIGQSLLAVICYKLLCYVTKQATVLGNRDSYQKAS